MVLFTLHLLTNKMSGAIIVTVGYKEVHRIWKAVVNCGILGHHNEEEEVYLGMDFPRA